MSLPKVSIVGRPNVGKSSIFNWLAGLRLAIVDEVAGVTRDRMQYVLEQGGRYFEIIDTGGIGINDVDQLDDEIEQQIEAGIREADLLMFVVDARDGLTVLDKNIAERLRSIGKPILLVANKCDGENWESYANDFFGLGLGEVIKVSAKNNRRRSELVDALMERLPESIPEPAELAEPVMKLAIVGRRNVGKSTFVNTLAGSERMIVSEVPGTTRDSVDVRFELDGKPFVAIDTPGLKKGKSIRSDIDFYSDHRAKRSIRHADVVLMFFDCGQRLSKVDKQLVHYIESEYKPCVFVVNKWDQMAPHMPTQRWADYLREQFSSLAYVPIAFITGKEGKNVKKLLNHAQMLFKQSRSRVTTGELNRLVRRALEIQPPPTIGTRRLKVFYATQISEQPPTIVLKCNDPACVTPTYRRYLITTLRDGLRFGEVPIRLFLEGRSEGASSEGKFDPTSPEATANEVEQFAAEEALELNEQELADIEPDSEYEW
ncbi:MAG: ribosome biogenesis GTPase Der [Planctomycetota bacterium]|jgi:GTP-binding protein